MKSFIALPVALALVAACSDDAATTFDARPDGPDVDAAVPRNFVQVEHLARPGIAEALLISNGFLAGYNATAPTFAGVDDATLQMVIGEAKTVLKALYLGACLINGELSLTPATGVKPSGVQCHEVGAAIFTTAAGTALTTESMTAAPAYADRVFSQFIPDVMRVDLSVASNYQTLCDNTAPANQPLLCGGRVLNEDTIDVTYDYLINGAATPKDLAIVSRLVSDGVNFSQTELQNSNNRVSAPVIPNEAQGHPAISNTVFPYSGNPL